MNRLPEDTGTEQALRELARVGFLAVHVGEPAAARAIFSALAVLRPDSTLPHIGRAMAEQAAGRMDEAVRWLREEGLKALPDNEELTAFLGLALVQADLPAQAASVLRAFLASEPQDGRHVRMAQALLDQLGAATPLQPA